MSMPGRNLIRHAPTDYSSLFVRGLPASLDAEDVRRYFCDRGYKCSVSFNKVNNEYYKLYVALQFESEKMARDIYNKYDNEQILGYNVGLSFYKDKNRLYRSEYDQRAPRARVGQPVDRRRFNRTPSRSPSPRSRRRRSSRSRSRNRSRSRHSDSDRSHRSRSHSGSSSPRRRNRSTSRDRKRRSRTNSSSSRSPSTPRNSRKRSKSPSRRSLSPYDGSRKRRHSRQSLSPSMDATVRSVITKRTSPSPEPKVKSLVDYSHSPPRSKSRSPRSKSRSPRPRSRSPRPRSRSPQPKSRRRTFSGNSSSPSSSSSDEDGDARPSSTKWKSTPSPSKSDKAPSPARSTKSDKPDSPEDKHLSSGEIPSSPVRNISEEELPEQAPKEKHKKHHKRKKESRKRHVSSDKTDEHERKNKMPQKASSLSSSIYGKVASFTDMNIQRDNSKSGGNKRKQNGGKAVDDSEDVEADLRAEFLNNNDALYDSLERTQSAGFPLVSKKKAEAEKILDDLPIDPLKDGHQYVSSSVEKEFTLTNGGSNVRTDANHDDWTPQMLAKLKVKKDEIIEAYKQDCDTFTTVVKMLISKDSDLEMRLQTALKENLKEIGQRCVQELNQVAEKLKEEAK